MVLLTNTTFSAQARLKCTLDRALEEIEKQTGLIGFTVLGGPSPKDGGDLMVMSCVLFTVLWQQFLIFIRAFSGTTNLGLHFGEEHDGWQTRIEEPFIAFLDKIFRASIVLLYVNTH